MHASASDVAAGFTQFVSFPDVVLQLDNMIENGVSDTDDFAQLISRDPGLTATLLGLANSTLYGFSGKISTVDRAISLIGMQEVRDLVLSVAIKGVLDKVPNQILTADEFWRFSLCCGLASRHVADVVRYSQKDTLFTASLLHDIGHQAMYHQMPDVCVEILLLTQYRMDDVEAFDLERQITGFDYQEVGAEIARAWRFPEVLQDTIGYQQVPENAPRHQFESAIVQVGTVVATMVELERTGYWRTPNISAFAMEILGLQEDRLFPMVSHIQTAFDGMRPVFGIAA